MRTEMIRRLNLCGVFFTAATVFMFRVFNADA